MAYKFVARRRSASGFSNPTQPMSASEQLASSIANQRTRLQSVGVTPATTEPKTPALLKALMALDKPRSAVWTGVEHAVKGEDVLAGLAEGWKQEPGAYTGQKLMTDLAGAQTENAGFAEKAARGVGGFVAEAVLDPLNLVTFGAGSLAKGVLTKGAGVVTKEIAEGVAKSALRNVTREAVENAAKRAVTSEAVDALATKVAREAASGMTEGAAREVAHKTLTEEMAQKLMADRTAKAASKFGVTAEGKAQAQVISEMTSAQLNASRQVAGKGLSVAGQTIIPEQTLIKAGGKLRAGLEKVPVLGKVVETLGDELAKVFSPSFIQGVDQTSRALLHQFTQEAKRFEGSLNMNTTTKFKEYASALKSMVGASPTVDDDISHAIEGSMRIADLPPAAQVVAKDMIKYYDDIGVDELDRGILHGALTKEYLPHIYSTENVLKKQAGSGVSGKLNVYTPSQKKRELGATLAEGDRNVKYATASASSADTFLNDLHKLFGIDAPDVRLPANKLSATIDNLSKDFIKRQVELGEPVEQATRLASEQLAKVPDLFRKLDGQGKTFESSSLQIFLNRAISHNKAVAGADLLDKIKATFGQRVGSYQMADTLAREGKRVVISRQSLNQGVLVTKAEQGIAQEAAAGGAAGVSAVSDEVARLAKYVLDGKEPFITLSPDQVRLLEGEAKGLLVNPTVLEAYAFEPGIVDAVNSAGVRQIDAGMKAIGGMVDRMYSIWKPLVYGLNPASQLRNVFGGGFNEFLDVGLRATFDPVTLKNSVLTGLKSASVADRFGHTGKEIFDAAMEYGAMQGTHAMDFAEAAVKSETRGIAASAGGTAAGETFTRIGKESVANKLAGMQTAATKGLNAVVKGSRKVSGTVEEQIRLSHFIASSEVLMEKGIPPEMAWKQAAEQVRKFQFDYTDLTKVEREGIRRFFPFYTWMRKNIPLQVEQFLNSPSKYAPILKAQRNFAAGTDTSGMPDYMNQNLAIPIPGTGSIASILMLNTGLPAASLNDLGNLPTVVMNALTPPVKAAIEITQNKSLLTGGPIWKETDAPEIVRQKQWQYALSQTGVLGGLYKGMSDTTAPGSKAVQPGVSPLVPFGRMVKQYNVAPANEQQQYNLNQALQNQIGQVKSGGRNVPTMDEIGKGGYVYVPRPRPRKAR